MNSAANKKEFFYIVVLVLTFITVVFGATFAIYYASLKDYEKGKVAVYTGTFSIEYDRGGIIGNGSKDFLKPTKEVPNLETVDNVYRNEFGVTSTGTLDGIIDVNIEIKKNDFPDNELMYALYDKENEEEPIVSGSLELDGKEEIKITEKAKKEDLELVGGQTRNFILFIWWNETDRKQNPGDGVKPGVDVEPLIFLGTLRIDANQKKY